MTRDELLEALTLERFTRHQRTPAPRSRQRPRPVRNDDLACAERRAALVGHMEFEDDLEKGA